jgi:2-oxoisovalerate dehydrogenase E1 component
LRQDRWAEKGRLIKEEIDSHVRNAEFIALSFEDYVKDQLPRKISAKLSAVSNPKKRMVQSLNDAYRKTLEIGAVHIGEDIEDPYGGAFKVTKGLSSDFPGHVLNSPISESGLIGVSIGMAIMGTPAFAEIMFGDFITHAFDQLISNASKFYNMYAFQASAPLRIRTPMGGKRGYGPTHSQSLEKHLLGIDNVCVVSLSSLLNPEDVIGDCAILKCPIVLLENKVDYGKYLWSDSSQFDLLREDRIFGSLRLSPKFSKPSITIVSYGETARQIADGLERFFIETDYIPELVCLIQLNPLDIGLVKRSVEGTNRLIIVEDGSVGFGIGSEVIGRLVEEGVVMESVMRIGAEPVPIPSVNTLELEVLPTMDRIIRLARNKSQRGRHD